MSARPAPRNKLILGDSKPAMQRMKRGSIDIISTDPPYVADLWEQAFTDLAEGATRVLRPGGFCLTYTPQRHLDDIIDIMRAGGLRYYWILTQLNLGNETAMVHDRNAICIHKPILAWCRPLTSGKLPKTPLVFCDVIRGFKQKAFHPWQQSIHDQLAMLSRFAVPGELLLDPYMGSGTSCLAAMLLGLDYLGYEKDPVTYAKAVDRMGQRPITMLNFARRRVA